MDAICNQITHYLLTQSWQIAALTIAVALAATLLKNKSAHVRYLLWLIVLAKCLVPPMYAVHLGIVPERMSVAGSSRAALRETITEGSVPTNSERALPAALSRETAASSTPDAEPLEHPTVTTHRPAPLARLNIRQGLGMIWAVGACVYLVMNLLRAVRGHFWLTRGRKALPTEVRSDIEELLRGHRIQHLPRIWLMPGMGQPFVWGLLGGSIYLPADFLKVRSREHRRDILAHEISHIVRFDAGINLLQIVAQAIFWFHPLVWWANKKIRQEREKCCDEMAIARLHAQPKDYGSAIVETLAAECRSRRPVPSLAIAGPVKNVEERIVTILKPGKRFYRRPSSRAIIFLLSAAVLIVPIGCVLTSRAESETPAPPQDKPATLHEAAAAGDISAVKSLLAADDVDKKDKLDYTPLHHAAENGHAELVNFLIVKGADLEARNHHGRTPLALAACRGHKQMLQLLIAKGADLNTKDIWYKRLLHHAAENGHADLARFLIDRGANIESKTNLGYTPLYLAASQGHRNTVELLIARGADLNPQEQMKYTPLHSVASKGHYETAKLLVTAGANVHAEDSQNRTPLYKAVMVGHKDIAGLLVEHGAAVPFPALHFAAFMADLPKVKKLIQEGAELDSNDGYGQTPLFFAARAGNRKVVEYLLDSGADVKLKTNGGRTILHYLARYGDNDAKDIMELLISKGAEVNVTAGAGAATNTPLDHAVLTGHADIAAVLLAHGADPDIKGYCSVMPLHRAAQKGRLDLAKLLLDHGADVNIRGGSIEITPLHWAAGPDHAEVAELLVAHGADVNAKDKNGVTPLHHAARGRGSKVAKILIAAGAEVNPEDNKGRTPLSWAQDKAHKEIVELLLNHGAKQ